MRISLFFPAYNEERNIALAIAQAKAVLNAIAEEYEIIVVDDGSTDRTGDIVDRLSVFDEKVRVVRHCLNRGYGAAVLSGIRAARYEWVFFTDADLQFRLEEIPRLIAYAPEYPVVIGYRAPRRDPLMRLINAKGWNILNRVMFGLKARDIDCAFKLFRRNLVSNLPMRSGGATVSAEMLIRLQRNNVPIKEVPVTHLPRKNGIATGAKLPVIVRAFRELFGLYISGLGGRDTVYVQAGKYAAVGILNTFVDIGSYIALTRSMPFFGMHILVSKFATFFVGATASFALNRRFTFSLRSRPTVSETVRFYSSTIVPVTINVASLYVFNILLGIYDLIAVGMSTVMTFAVGFILSKFWIFKDSLAEESERQRLSARTAATISNTP